MSRIKISGLSSSIFSRAILPDPAVPTTRMCGSAERTLVMTRRTTTESSAIRTAIGVTGSLR